MMGYHFWGNRVSFTVSVVLNELDVIKKVWDVFSKIL